jgi:DNA polymerase-3 subunit delta'
LTFSQILGQERAKSFLKKVVARERMPHAYLFTGIAGIGKTSAAMALAMTLNCKETVDGEGCGTCQSCRQMLSGNFPDFIEIKHRNNKKNISLDQIKDVNRELRFEPVSGRYRVIIIHRAETMTLEAANSFLKTLEEPPPGNIVILNTIEPRDLLPTIVSRCQRVSFQPLPVKEMANWLVKERDLHEETAMVLARVSGGSLGRALKMSEEGFVEKRQNWLLSLLSLPGLSKQKAVDMAFEYADEDKKRGARSLGNDEIGVSSMLAVWESWYRDLVVMRAGGSTDLLINADFSNKLKKIEGRFIINTLINSLLTIDRAQRDLQRNYNTRLVMENTVLRLKELLKEWAA